jgi:hypothetical protein
MRGQELFFEPLRSIYCRYIVDTSNKHRQSRRTTCTPHTTTQKCKNVASTAVEVRIVDMVSVEDSRESAPRVASKIEQKDALKADVVAKVSVNSVDPTSADTAALTSVKPAQLSAPRWVYSEVPPSR